MVERAHKEWIVKINDLEFNDEDWNGFKVLGVSKGYMVEL
jgi:hypothetical protein